MKTDHIKIAQQILNERVSAGLTVDGIAGPKTEFAAKRFVGHLPVRGRMTRQRWIALTIQHGANLADAIEEKIDEDGFWGPQSIDAAYRLMGPQHVGWRPDEQPEACPGVKTVRCWTPTDRQMIQKFGQPGSNQIMIPLPYVMRLDWDLSTTTTRTQCHRLFADPITLALTEILAHYGHDGIKKLGLDRFGGILNVRKKRGGSTWSSHAWGTAIDLWPSMNQLRWKRDRAVFARPEYDAFRRIVVKYGLMSLGDCYNFDWMHWQLNP